MIKAHTMIVEETHDGKYTSEASLSNFKICDNSTAYGTITLKYECDSKEEARDRLLHELREARIILTNDFEVYYQ